MNPTGLEVFLNTPKGDLSAGFGAKSVENLKSGSGNAFSAAFDEAARAATGRDSVSKASQAEPAEKGAPLDQASHANEAGDMVDEPPGGEGPAVSPGAAEAAAGGKALPEAGRDLPSSASLQGDAGNTQYLDGNHGRGLTAHAVPFAPELAPDGLSDAVHRVVTADPSKASGLVATLSGAAAASGTEPKAAASGTSTVDSMALAGQGRLPGTLLSGAPGSIHPANAGLGSATDAVAVTRDGAPDQTKGQMPGQATNAAEPMAAAAKRAVEAAVSQGQAKPTVESSQTPNPSPMASSSGESGRPNLLSQAEARPGVIPDGTQVKAAGGSNDPAAQGLATGQRAARGGELPGGLAPSDPTGAAKPDVLGSRTVDAVSAAVEKPSPSQRTETPVVKTERISQGSGQSPDPSASQRLANFAAELRGQQGANNSNPASNPDIEATREFPGAARENGLAGLQASRARGGEGSRSDASLVQTSQNTAASVSSDARVYGDGVGSATRTDPRTGMAMLSNAGDTPVEDGLPLPGRDGRDQPITNRGAETSATSPVGSTQSPTPAPVRGPDTATPQSQSLPNMGHAPDSGEFPEEMLSRIRLLQTRGGQEARLNLHPAELGRLQIAISTEGDTARVAFTVDNAMARDALEQAMPRLRELLNQAGLQLADSSVAEQGHGEFAQSEDRLDSAGTAAAINDEGDDTDVNEARPRGPDPDRAIDAYA